MTINQSNTLNKDGAKEENDERHIAPLQLDLIERCVILWSNPGEVVLSPFAGIGSEGYISLQQGRRFVGVELKPTYFQQAAKNLQSVGRINTAGFFGQSVI
jgi:DNA modification methylase